MYLAAYGPARSERSALHHGKGWARADTIWMGVVDEAGRGSELYSEHTTTSLAVASNCPASGVNWQNRGFAVLAHPNAATLFTARPQKTLPYLNRRWARFNDRRTMVYGNMGAMAAAVPKRGLQPHRHLA